MRKIAFLIDPIDTLLLHHDSSIGMMAASLQLGCEVYFFEAQDLFLKEGAAYAHLTPIIAADLSQEAWYQQGLSQPVCLTELDIIIVRKDPPFNIDYVFMTYLLELAHKTGVYVTNPPRALRDFNEKLVIFNFPELMPPSLVSANKEDIRQFWEQHGEIILKPLDGMGGANIFHIKPKDPNFPVACEILTHHGKRPIIAQKYLSEIKKGDRRIILFYGEPVNKVLVRIPKKDESRANIAVGGTYAFDDLSKRDRYLCEQIKPFILKENLSLVGLDVIGDYITEMNITSPTMLRELGIALAQDLSKSYMQQVLTRLSR
jgi:glutathione synthase